MAQEGKNKMKDELKTLKNIYGKKRSDRRISRISLIEDFKQDLKAEAVKWVKNLNKDLYGEGEADYLDKLKISGLNSTIEFIKLFFNLKESDLK